MQASACNLLKKRLWRRCFPVNFAKVLRTISFIEHLQVTASFNTHRVVLKMINQQKIITFVYKKNPYINNKIYNPTRSFFMILQKFSEQATESKALDTHFHTDPLNWISFTSGNPNVWKKNNNQKITSTLPEWWTTSFERQINRICLRVFARYYFQIFQKSPNLF